MGWCKKGVTHCIYVFLVLTHRFDVLWYHTQRTRDAIIMSLLCQNDVAMSFWCNNDVISMMCVRWKHYDIYHPHLYVCWPESDCTGDYNHAWSGGRFKKAYELLNLRALKISLLYKNIFQCIGIRYFVWNFKGTLHLNLNLKQMRLHDTIYGCACVRVNAPTCKWLIVCTVKKNPPCWIYFVMVVHY